MLMAGIGITILGRVVLRTVRGNNLYGWDISRDDLFLYGNGVGEKFVFVMCSASSPPYTLAILAPQ